MRRRALCKCRLLAPLLLSACASTDGENRGTAGVPFARFSVQGGLSATTAEISGSRTLPEELTPDANLYSESPLQGTFKGLGLTSLRTVESLFVSVGGGRDVVLGIGLDSLSTGEAWGTFEKKPQGGFDLQLWSLAFESGLRRRGSLGQAVEILMYGMWGLGGKAHFRYKARGASTGQARSTAMDDGVSRAWRVALAGRYTMPVLSFLEVGLQTEGDYGSLVFDSSSRKGSMQGIAASLVLQMSIE